MIPHASAHLPFASHRVDLEQGTMHYLDEGQGEVVLLLHGNPTWCWYYRAVAAALRDRYRVIAPDHLGFGLSRGPDDAPHTLAWHRDNLGQFVEALALERYTLVVHDWGGPIGLAHVTDHPEQLRRLVLLNTWAFPAPAETTLPTLLSALRTPALGEWLALEQNALVEQGIPAGMAQPGQVTPGLMAAYRRPFPTPESRRPILALAREIPLGPGSEAHLILARVQRRLRRLKVPALLLWGERDPVFPPSILDLWRVYLPWAEVQRLPDASHFVLEDQPERCCALLDDFLTRTAPAA